MNLEYMRGRIKKVVSGGFRFGGEKEIFTVV
jgi:hypothetical protein